MKNYGEELAYWYLRLNGFFVLDNFVYHQTQHNRTGDADLLAIRLPHVKEVIGGRTDDWDEELFSYLDEYEIAGVLCEVKTGPRANPSSAFKKHKLRYALNRIGFSNPDIEEMLSKHENYCVLESNRNKFLKLVVSEYEIKSTRACLTLSLEYIEDFIYNRIEIYRSQKYNARHFFPSSLLQYMMYRKDKELSGRWR
ncbi:hypothetical protein OOG41_08665 [Bacillus sp. AS_5]|uniref:hypothetical protein n=1 Tax=unclassified Bacillus (in: firmicutes) TaxID=185979 RepID=UPI0022496B62|nr:hypothetical protein [Bacillus sp. AS_3]MCW4655797.1 hypothetical protein [Bacillus sp. AS_3]MCX2701180.1 hypothetical protein [Bacillus sp. AS_5]